MKHLCLSIMRYWTRLCVIFFFLHWWMNTTDTSCLPVLSVCLCGLFHYSLWNTYNDTTIFEKYSFSALLGPFWPQNGVLGSQHWKLGKTKSKSKISAKKRCKSMYDTTLFDFFYFGPLWTPFDPFFGPKKGKRDFFLKNLFQPVLTPYCLLTSSKKWEKMNDSIFTKVSKTSFWVHFGPFWPKNIYPLGPLRDIAVTPLKSGSMMLYQPKW